MPQRTSARSIGVEWKWVFLLILLLGLTLRIIYLWQTPFFDREHDVNAHIDYIRFVADNWTIPPSNAGWEFHQAPLYYFVVAPFYALGRSLGWNDDLTLRGIQILSLAFSAITLFSVVAIGRRLFPKREKLQQVLFMLGLVTLPALIINATPISNDALFHPLSFLFFALLIRWWQTEKWRDWHWMVLVAIAAWLTKASALLFVPIAFGCLLLKTTLPVQKRITHGLIAAVAIMILGGWLIAWRTMAETNPVMLPFNEVQGLSDSVLVRNSWENFLVFRPAQFIAIPYNLPHSDDAGRQYFWEYFLRSAFSGEWNFGSLLAPLHSATLFLSLLLVLAAIRGVAKTTWKSLLSAAPVWLTGIFVLVGALMYRIDTPCACNQDFRFSPLLAIPAFFFIVQGIRYKGTFGAITESIYVLFIVCSAAMTVLVWLA